MKLYIRRKNDSVIPLEIETIGEFEPIPDGFCYVLGREGLREHRSNDVYDTFALTSNCPQLATQPLDTTFKLPKIKQTTIATIVGFFHQVYERYQSEAIILLYFSAVEGVYMLLVPHQEVNVWMKTPQGFHACVDLKYEVPPTPVKLLKRGYKLVGTIHSHGSAAAYHSKTDDFDEKDHNGLHITVGNINRAKKNKATSVTFACSLMVNGERQTLKTTDVVEPFKQLQKPPVHWIGRVKQGEKPASVSGTGYSSSVNYYTPYGGGYGSLYTDRSLPTLPTTPNTSPDQTDCYGDFDGEDPACLECADATDCLIAHHTEPVPGTTTELSDD